MLLRDCVFGLGGSFGGFDGDTESECFDLVSQTAGMCFGAATHEPVSPQILIGDVAVEHGAGGNKVGVLNGLTRFGMPAASAVMSIAFVAPCMVPNRKPDDRPRAAATARGAGGQHGALATCHVVFWGS